MYYVLLTVYILFSAADLVLTVSLIARYGPDGEANPVARQLWLWFGDGGLVVLKLSSAAVVTGATWWLWEDHPRYAGWLLAFGCLVYGFAVVNNWRIP